MSNVTFTVMLVVVVFAIIPALDRAQAWWDARREARLTRLIEDLPDLNQVTAEEMEAFFELSPAERRSTFERWKKRENQE